MKTKQNAHTHYNRKVTTTSVQKLKAYNYQIKI